MGKHTEAFNKQLEGKKYIKESSVDFAKSQNFILRMSKEQCQAITDKICETRGVKWVSDRAIYAYCYNNDIKPDGEDANKYSFDEDKAPDYSGYAFIDEIEIKGRSGIVMENNIEEKKITITWDDDDSIEVIDYK